MSTFRMNNLRDMPDAEFIRTAVMYARLVRTAVDRRGWEKPLFEAREVAKERGLTEAVESAIEADRNGGAT